MMDVAIYECSCDFVSREMKPKQPVKKRIYYEAWWNGKKWIDSAKESAPKGRRMTQRLSCGGKFVTRFEEGLLFVGDEKPFDPREHGWLLVMDEQTASLHIARATCQKCRKSIVVIHTGWDGHGGRLTSYKCRQCGVNCGGHGFLTEMSSEDYFVFVVWDEEEQA